MEGRHRGGRSDPDPAGCRRAVRLAGGKGDSRGYVTASSYAPYALIGPE